MERGREGDRVRIGRLKVKHLFDKKCCAFNPI